jgi:hypothetical protein
MHGNNNNNNDNDSHRPTWLCPQSLRGGKANRDVQNKACQPPRGTGYPYK